jgi:vacuolar iron transporter family protein
MPTIPHVEKHFTGSASVRDVVIGMADGLTVPFALAAGLSAAVRVRSRWGLGGYLAARTDQEHYQSEERREYGEVDNLREREVREVETIFKGYGLEGEGLQHAVDAITNNRQRWVDFMMRFELGLERPDPARAPISAATIAISYLVGGLIPLAPYIFTSRIDLAFRLSVLLTGVALIVFGAVKGRLTGLNVVKSSVQTAAVGGLAAAAAYYLASLFG